MQMATLPAVVAPSAAAAVPELAPELGGLDRLGEDERVEDDDGGVRDHLDQDELGPEDVVLLVVLVLPQVRAPREERNGLDFSSPSPFIASFHWLYTAVHQLVGRAFVCLLLESTLREISTQQASHATPTAHASSHFLKNLTLQADGQRCNEIKFCGKF